MSKYLYKNEVVELFGIYQFADTIEASPLIGGAPAGQIAWPVAVVRKSNSKLLTVRLSELEVADE